MKGTDPFFTEDLSVLFSFDKLSSFYITSGMTKNEKLNAITRFFTYTTLSTVLYYNDLKYIFILLFVIGIMIALHSGMENFTEISVPTPKTDEFVKPTIDNPFMNPNVFDDPSTFKATKYSDNTQESNDVKKDIYSKFSYNLFKDSTDIFDTNNGFRQFYTVPDHINNYQEFKQFIHGDTNYSAKENTYDGFKNLYDPLNSKTNRN